MSAIFTPFQGATALITGASSGIGMAYAKKLASLGLHLVLTARSEQALQNLAHALRTSHPINVEVIVLDLAQLGAAQELFETLQTKKIQIDCLINNAGFGKWTAFAEQSIAIYHEMMILNMLSLTTLCHLFLPHMIENKRGIIINIASTGAFQPLPYIAVYGATKSFVLNFSEALAGEYADSGIRCLAVCPGNTATNFTQVAQADTQGMPSSSVDDVVNATLHALDQHKSTVIVGIKNYWIAQLTRFLPRQQVIQIVKNTLQKRVIHK